MVRVFVIRVTTAATLLLLSALLSDAHVKDFGAALVAAILLGLVNAVIWPVLVRLALPFTVLTLGLGVVVLNGAMVLLVAAIQPGLEVAGLGAGIIVALGITVVTTAVMSLPAIDDDAFSDRHVVRREARRTEKPEPTDVPGLFLVEQRVDGEDPLAPFGPHAALHVKRTDESPHCPDIVVNSTYCPDTDEVAAFEELVGSHGGMGGTQSFPFLLHAPDLELPDQELIGADTVHRHLRRWLVELGHAEYAETGAPVP